MQLEAKPEWFQYILVNMKDAVLLTAKNGDLLNANPAARELLGLELHGGVKIWDAIPFVEENDGLIQLFIDGVMQKRSVNSTVRYVNPDGQHFHLHVTLTCGQDSDGMILVVIHDLTSLTKVHSAFARYTSPEIADYVLSTPEGAKQGGSSREVSILMSDLRGFTAMSTQMSSEDLITMLNHYFEIMSAVIRYFRGTVIEFLGDGIFVVFGAPLELQDHASAAVACAIDMQNAMEEVNTWNREHGYPDLEMGIAVNSGTAVVGNIGSDQKMKYGCMGETVNLAGRLETFSLGGEVCISEATRKLLPEKIMIIEENAFMPKGGSIPMKFYNIGGYGESYTLSSFTKGIRWRKLSEAKDLTYYLLDGKTVDPQPHTGNLAEVSTDRKFGLLVTEDALQPLQNLLLKIGGIEVYAKVKNRGDRGCRIGFTTNPEGFSELIS